MAGWDLAAVVPRPDWLDASSNVSIDNDFLSSGEDDEAAAFSASPVGTANFSAGKRGTSSIATGAALEASGGNISGGGGKAPSAATAGLSGSASGPGATPAGEPLDLVEAAAAGEELPDVASGLAEVPECWPAAARAKAAAASGAVPATEDSSAGVNAAADGVASAWDEAEESTPARELGNAGETTAPAEDAAADWLG